MSAYDGFFVVDKPSGVTSFSIVSLARRLTGVRRVGHAGTLDPLASGVLPVSVVALVIVVIWFYYASFIFIIGGEVAQVYELRRVRKMQREAFED